MKDKNREKMEEKMEGKNGGKNGEKMEKKTGIKRINTGIKIKIGDIVDYVYQQKNNVCKVFDICDDYIILITAGFPRIFKTNKSICERLYDPLKKTSNNSIMNVSSYTRLMRRCKKLPEIPWYMICDYKDYQYVMHGDTYTLVYKNELLVMKRENRHYPRTRCYFVGPGKRYDYWMQISLNGYVNLLAFKQLKEIKYIKIVEKT